MKILFYISLTSFLANATVLTKTPSQYYLCYFQGLFQQFFYPASWLWTTTLTYLLYSLVSQGKITTPWWRMHLICWGIPTVITFMPLTTEFYGSTNNDDDWCWLQPIRSGTMASNINQFWELLSFDVIIFGCFFLMSYWGFCIYYAIRVQRIEPTPMVLSALNILIYYPIIIFVTWFPNAIMETINDDNLAQDGWTMVLINSLSLWQGGLIAITFFIKSREARYHWYYFFAAFCGDSCHRVLRTLTVSVAAHDVDMYSERDVRSERGSQQSQDQSSTHSFSTLRQTEIYEDFEDDNVYRGISRSSRLTSDVAPTHKQNLPGANGASPVGGTTRKSLSPAQNTAQSNKIIINNNTNNPIIFSVDPSSLENGPSLTAFMMGRQSLTQQPEPSALDQL